MTAAVEIGAEPRRRAWIQVLLIIVACVETLGAVSALPVLFGDLSEVPGPGWGGWTITGGIVARPVFAITALVLAARGRLRHAILALAAVVMVNWLNMLPSVVLHGLDFQSGAAAYASAHFLLSPVLAAAAAWLAWDNRLLPAAIIVSVQCIADMFGTLVFAIAVMIYGF
jgi:hypothetical protein